MPYLFRLKTLLKLLEDEGLDPGEINAFLKEEMENGWLGKLVFSSVVKRRYPYLFRPIYHWPIFGSRKEVELELMEKLEKSSLWSSTTGKGYLLLLLISLGLGK